jgi:hypothetical protein
VQAERLAAGAARAASQRPHPRDERRGHRLSARHPIFAQAPVATAPGVAAGTEGDVRTWAQAELRRAASALSSRDYASARAILASVREKAGSAPEGREAAKGDVAIWNLRKIERAGTPDDAVRLRARAKADLEATVFEALFA